MKQWKKGQRRRGKEGKLEEAGLGGNFSKWNKRGSWEKRDRMTSTC